MDKDKSKAVNRHYFLNLLVFFFVGVIGLGIFAAAGNDSFGSIFFVMVALTGLTVAEVKRTANRLYFNLIEKRGK